MDGSYMPRFPMSLTLLAFDAASLGRQKRGLTAKCLTAVEALTKLRMHPSDGHCRYICRGLGSRLKYLTFSAGGGCCLQLSVYHRDDLLKEGRDASQSPSSGGENEHVYGVESSSRFELRETGSCLANMGTWECIMLWLKA